MGRPSGYSVEIAAKICDLISDGISLRTICKRDDMPAKITVLDWLGKHPEFTSQYARAREVQADVLAEENLEIADDATNDWMANNDPENPGYKLFGENVQRSRLRVDTRKWFASKVAPKKYGDKLDLHQTGSVTVEIKR